MASDNWDGPAGPAVFCEGPVKVRRHTRQCAYPFRRRLKISGNRARLLTDADHGLVGAGPPNPAPRHAAPGEPPRTALRAITRQLPDQRFPPNRRQTGAHSPSECHIIGDTFFGPPLNGTRQ